MVFFKGVESPNQTKDWEKNSDKKLSFEFFSAFCVSVKNKEDFICLSGTGNGEAGVN